MRNKWLYLTALSIILAVALAPSLSAAQAPSARQKWTSTEEFRTEYLNFIDTLSAHIPESDQSTWAVGLREKISDIRQQVNDLSDPAVEQFSKMTDRGAFKRMADGVAAGTNKVENKDRVAGRFRPLGAIESPDYVGAVAGTTCSTTPTDAKTLDGEKIGLYIDIGLQVPLDYSCEAFVEILGEGTNLPFCIAAGIGKAVEVVLGSLIDHQEFCNGLLDGAKTDATFNDIVDIHGDVDALDTHLTNVDNHVATEFGAIDAHIVALVNELSTQITGSTNLLSAGLKQVMKLELTPEGRRQIAPSILTCTVAANNCPNVLLNCTGAGGACSWNNVGPLP